MMEMQMKLQRALATRGALAALARESGLSHTALQKLASGKTQNPGIKTVERIEAALRIVCPDAQPELVLDRDGNRITDTKDLQGAAAAHGAPPEPHSLTETSGADGGPAPCNPELPREARHAPRRVRPARGARNPTRAGH